MKRIEIFEDLSKLISTLNLKFYPTIIESWPQKNPKKTPNVINEGWEGVRGNLNGSH